MFHKEGHYIITVSFIITAMINLLSRSFIDNNTLIYSIGIVTIIILVLILQFFRNPKRKTTANKNHIIAPVDGKVVVIEEVYEKEFFKDKRLQVSIFMSPLNIHVTRYAISGAVAFSK